MALKVRQRQAEIITAKMEDTNICSDTVLNISTAIG